MIKELFLRQFPEYNTDNFEITVNHSQRFSDTGGDIIVKKECSLSFYTKILKKMYLFGIIYQVIF